MSVLVTGGAGFIGSRLARALAERGECVTVLDNFDPLAHSGTPANADLDGIDLVTGDLRDRDAVESALSGVNRVFHLGGVVGNGESTINVARAVDNNALGTANLIEAIIARRDQFERVVLASSMVVYGEGGYACGEHGPIEAPTRSSAQLAERHWDLECPLCSQPLDPLPAREHSPLRPTSVYGVTKRTQEELGLVLGSAYGIDTVALRYLNVYGAGQALGNPYTGVAAIFAARALAGQPPLVFEDGRQLRDLVHVADVVEATIAAMQAPDAAGHAINIASGTGLRIIELAQRIAAALGGPEPVVTGEYRAGDIRHCIADTTLANELLGWRTKRGLDDGLPELTEWVAWQTPDARCGETALAELRTVGLIS